MCSIENCEKLVHSKGLCQNHYRKAQRASRGLSKPGPKPNPEAPRSRYGQARQHEGNGYFTLIPGGVCKKGHELTTDTIYTSVTSSGKTRSTCKVCRQDRYLVRKGSIPGATVGVWNRDKTHCPQGHEYTTENTYVHPSTNSRRCLTCHTTQYRTWYLRKNYDISLEQFENMLDSQEGKCAGCKATFDNDVKVDHDHETGEVRGLLCQTCNLLLGHAYDNPEILRSLANYLESFSNTDIKE